MTQHFKLNWKMQKIIRGIIFHFLTNSQNSNVQRRVFFGTKKQKQNSWNVFYRSKSK